MYMSKSTSRFEQIFLQLLDEDITSAAVNTTTQTFNPNNNISSSDSYAPGDARIPKSIFGGVVKRGGFIKSKRRRRKKRKTNG